MTTFLDRVARACELHRDRPAFFIREHSYTYGEFVGAVGAVQALLDREAASEANIGIQAHDDLHTYAAVFACWFSGKTIVPLGTTHPPERNARIAERAGLQVVLSSRNDEGSRLMCERAGARRFLTGDFAHPPCPLRRGEASGGAVLYILFTSGSTGIPKGVPITHRALEGFLDAFDRLGFDLGPDDRVLQMFDLTFDLSLMSYVVPLTLGACVYTVPPDSIKYTYASRLLDEQRLTCALMVPSILARLRPFFAELSLPDLRVSMFCGEALNDDLATGWSACAPNARVLNVYGPTEATIFCTTYECARGVPHKGANGIVSIGRPMAGVGVRIIDDAKQQAAQGAKGELCLSGRQLSRGYWRDPERTEAAFFDDGGETWYRTGDLCVADAEGDLLYYGRVDHQVKVQGYRVELSEIEHHVREISGVKNVAAVARKSAEGEVAIHLFLEDYAGDIQALLAALKTRVPPYMVPAKTRSLASLPLNANGKIDRRALEHAED
jgi:amino acid adenylation domain-containing protein